MTHVATLISNSASPPLDEAALKLARAALPASGDPVWLAPSVAADIPFTPSAEKNQSAMASQTLFASHVRAALRPHLVDVVVQPTANRRKRLFLADMDSTMIGQECIDELADYVGVKAHVAAITERAMRGEIAFEPALRERVALLKGLSADVVDDVIKTRIRLTPGGPELVATMRANGAYTCLVSGGFTLFTARVAAMIGFDEDRANILNVANGKFSGTVTEPILGKEAKLATLQELTARYNLKREDTLAIGDGANDIPMIQGAGLGVAYRGKPAVAAAASAQIDHGDLSALLYIQGYKRGEFVTLK